VKIYGIRNCDTLKKAFAFLEAKKLAYDFRRPVLEAGAKLLVGFEPAQYAKL
jgi:arsenate reductase-like glutaredoxin family protein